MIRIIKTIVTFVEKEKPPLYENKFEKYFKIIQKRKT